MANIHGGIIGPPKLKKWNKSLNPTISGRCHSAARIVIDIMYLKGFLICLQNTPNFLIYQTNYMNYEVVFKRVWEMPNSNTFDIKCISKLIHKYLKPEFESADPFANKCKLAKVTNDLNPKMDTDYNLDAVDFLKQFADNSLDFVFYDPPYSLRQVSECYKNVGITVTKQTTQSSWRTKHINEISRIVKPNGIVMCFGWNSSGIGKKRGFELLEVLLVAHGGSHNDTICTVERKLPTLF